MMTEVEFDPMFIDAPLRNPVEIELFYLYRLKFGSYFFVGMSGAAGSFSIMVKRFIYLRL